MIEVRNLSKVFRIPHAKKKTLFHNAISTLTKSYDYEEFHALKGVNFHIGRGECVGIIGRNGSGKSTLLKILAGIYRPSTGEVKINDEVFPLLELGVGFQPDFTVRDNIYIYGALLGFSRREIDQKLQEILTFAELDRFVDAKLEKLSSGMQMRLGFSIAVQSIAPIMLVDEVLAVGDLVFAEKCKIVFSRLLEARHTIILVSHDLVSVREYCPRSIVLDHGEIVADGKTDEMIDFYQQRVLVG
jgi:lipopolysaccharide transport system ATP-binding protein